MIHPKTVIIGAVCRVDGKLLYVRKGDQLDCYNSDYYRVINEINPSG